MIDGNERMKELLAEFQSNRDLPALLLKCAEWTVDVIESFSFKPLPMKPQDIRDFESIPEEDRKHLTSAYFSSNPQIMAFYNLERHIQAENKAIYEWLSETKTRLLENGLPEKARIVENKLEEVLVEQVV